MKVFKFGGASVKDAEAVKNVARIIDLYQDDLVIVVSAMGKTTNALENVVDHFFNKDVEKALHKTEEIIDYHLNILNDLTLEQSPTLSSIEALFSRLKERLMQEPSSNYDYEYDQIVSFGELISTTIISGYLNSADCLNTWLDARKLIRTSNKYREGKVDWETTEELLQNKVTQHLNQGLRFIGITQGFIGHTDTNQTCTLGREGSDFTAGILAWSLNAEDVTIWKDVPGMLNADPKHFNNCQKLDSISYREAIELSYFGASVIHPKTIKPLQNKQIPLFVKSFIHPTEKGTEIQSSIENDTLIPSYIFKQNQILVSISPRDFSFIAEDNLSDIFSIFSENSVKINLMQNSALKFSACMDDQPERVEQSLEQLSENYSIKYNKDVELLTVRHYSESIIQQLTQGKEILVEQKTRQTARFIMK